MKFKGSNALRKHKRVRRKMARKPKTEDHLLAHTKRRFLERYGKYYTTEDIQEMAKIIQNGHDVSLIARQSLHKTIFNVPYDGDTYTLVYDNRRHAIATVLPRNHSWLSHDEALNLAKNRY